MACKKCGGRRADDPAPDNRALRSGQTLTFTRDGVLPLASYPDQLTPYHGPHSLASVYVVGLMTDQERLFRRKLGRDAYKYARDNNLQINPVSARNLPQPAVDDLFADHPLDGR